MECQCAGDGRGRRAKVRWAKHRSAVQPQSGPRFGYLPGRASRNTVNAGNGACGPKEMHPRKFSQCTKERSIYGMEWIAPMLAERAARQFFAVANNLRLVLPVTAAMFCHLSVVSIDRRVGQTSACGERAVSMGFTLKMHIGTRVGETCAERGRPNEPVDAAGVVVHECSATAWRWFSTFLPKAFVERVNLRRDILSALTETDRRTIRSRCLGLRSRERNMSQQRRAGRSDPNKASAPRIVLPNGFG
jgi:hypothetical protein